MTTSSNGRTERKSLAGQLDRLDLILDGLADGLNEAVATAVKQAVVAAVEAAVRELLASAELQRRLHPEPAGKPGFVRRAASVLCRGVVSLVKGCCAYGVALIGQGRHREAEAACREAIRLKHDYAEAYCMLGHVLQQQGRFGEALHSLRRGHTQGSPRPGWPYPSAAWVRQCQRLLELVLLDEAREPFRPGDVRPLADRDKVRLGPDRERFKSA